jgi:hypothetical protein
MDSVEFPDGRLLLDGACFSLEPGIYFPGGAADAEKNAEAAGFGMRSEIDVYIKDGKALVSGGAPQSVLLCC